MAKVRPRGARRRPARPRPQVRRSRRPGRDHVRTNLRSWESQSRSYDRRFASELGGRNALAWGFWRIPESRLRVLGDVRGRTVLELGCGAARWSTALARLGARAIGLDFSSEQLVRARSLQRRARVRPDLLRANAERIPLADASVDVVFCDWGAMTFCDPRRTVPEAARVLRRGGVLAFANSSPFRSVAQDRRTDAIGSRLRYPYFDLHRIAYANEVDFQLPYGTWIRLFHTHGFVLEELLENQAPLRRGSAYLNARENAWGRSWPLEVIWKVRKE